jgi:hypothetical protein
MSETIAPLAEGGDMGPNGEKNIEIGRGAQAVAVAAQTAETGRDARRRRLGVGLRFLTGNGVAVPVGLPI